MRSHAKTFESMLLATSCNWSYRYRHSVQSRRRCRLTELVGTDGGHLSRSSRLPQEHRLGSSRHELYRTSGRHFQYKKLASPTVSSTVVRLSGCIAERRESLPLPECRRETLRTE